VRGVRDSFPIPLPDEAGPDFTTRTSMQSGVRVMVMVLVNVRLESMGVIVPRDELQTTIWINGTRFWLRTLQIPAVIFEKHSNNTHQHTMEDVQEEPETTCLG